MALLGLLGDSGARESGHPVDGRLAAADTAFSFKLFTKLLDQDSGKNIFASPLSVAMVLDMIYNGAVGETKQAMAQTLELGGMTHAELNRANAQLRAALKNADPKVQWVMANSLWARQGVAFNPAFLKRNKDSYGADIAFLDFNDPGAPASINAWVSKTTKGKIDKIVDTIDSSAVLFLINAIYFKGAWAVAFDKSRTKDGVFTLSDGRQKPHPMMSQSGDYHYYQGNGFQAASLPYGAGRVRMYVFLPDKGSSLAAFYKNLDAKNWQHWMAEFHPMEGHIVLPRFKMEYEVELNGALQALGMGVAFHPGRANFEGMSAARNIYISKVKHKTFVEVNEEGTEAAAVTSGEMRATAVRQSFHLAVDRPFFFAIRDNKTGIILFMGSVLDPRV